MLLFTACGGDRQPDENGGETPAQTVEKSLELPADFSAFYNKFHQNEDYQLEHIVWPLKGLPDQVDAETLAADNFYFKKEDWVIHRPIRDPDQEFDQYFAIIDDGLIIEKIESKILSMSMERRFAKIDTAWYLIYYQGMNQMK